MRSEGIHRLIIILALIIALNLKLKCEVFAVTMYAYFILFHATEAP